MQAAYMQAKAHTKYGKCVVGKFQRNPELQLSLVIAFSREQRTEKAEAKERNEQKERHLLELPGCMQAKKREAIRHLRMKRKKRLLT